MITHADRCQSFPNGVVIQQLFTHFVIKDFVAVYDVVGDGLFFVVCCFFFSSFHSCSNFFFLIFKAIDFIIRAKLLIQKIFKQKICNTLSETG